MAASAALSADDYALALARKTAGNGRFKAGELVPAITEWDAFLAIYGSRAGNSEQRLEKAKVFSNKAEAFLKLGRHAEARDACSAALELDAVNYKARFRRARSCLALGGWEDLVMASEDVKQIQADGYTIGAAEAALLKTTEGKPLLSGVAKTPTSAPAVVDEAAQDEARRRAAATVAALAPELAKATALIDQGADNAERERNDAASSKAPSVCDASGEGDSRAGGRCGNGEESGDEDEEERAFLARRREKRLQQFKVEQANAGDSKTLAWADQLGARPASERYAWLVDCYRTRVDADACAEAKAVQEARAAGRPLPPATKTMVKGGPRASRLSILSDFLVFCKLCVACTLCTHGSHDDEEWEWSALLHAAGAMLDKGFHPEKCGAGYRYGEAAAGDAMRRVGAMVYDASKERVDALRQAVLSVCWGDDATDDDGMVLHRFSFESGADAGIFDDVGGVELWQALNQTLKATRLG